MRTRSGLPVEAHVGRFQTPKSVADAALRQGAQVVGVSRHSWEHLQLAPQLPAELSQRKTAIPAVTGGSVTTAAEEMRATGVSAVFASGAGDSEIVDGIRDLCRAKFEMADTNP